MGAVNRHNEQIMKEKELQRKTRALEDLISLSIFLGISVLLFYCIGLDWWDGLILGYLLDLTSRRMRDSS